MIFNLIVDIQYRTRQWWFTYTESLFDSTWYQFMYHQLRWVISTVKYHHPILLLL